MQRSWMLALVLVTACGSSAPRPMPAAPGPTLASIATDVSSRGELALRRAVQLERLEAYWLAGVIPLDDAGDPLSVFRDAEGRECPMAHLITMSGNKHLVDQVVATNNTLRLADVTDGPLLAWMKESGLTRDEIILVQGVPRYGLNGNELQFENFNRNGVNIPNLNNVEVVVPGPNMSAQRRQRVKNRMQVVVAQLRTNTPNDVGVALQERIAVTAPKATAKPRN